MAKKSKKPKEDKIRKELEGDIQTATELRNKFLPVDPLQHYQDPRATDTNNLLNLRLAYADPHNPSFAGAYGADDLGILNRLQRESDPNSSEFVGQNSPEIEDVINRFKGGLEGYTAAENAGFREQAQRGLDADARNLRYQQMRDNAAGRVRGAAASAGLSRINRDRQMAGAQMEQDIFLKNADEKRSRLMDYSNFMRQNDDTNFGRRQSAFKDFRDFERGLSDTYYQRGQDAINSYEGTLGNARNADFEIGKFNIGQDEKTQTRDVGSSMGLLQLLGSKRSEERQNKILGKK